ncbi:MAG: DNA-3-methyladenine glycosylase I [Alphaproteobacteria bacterium]|nr:DNA-3-methyladenine glycosylase I [Alphaproteobacteria bacterium]
MTSSPIKRCAWAGNDSLYIHYHDTEWGRPSFDDRYLFEKICLEGFQAGLSWITILRKRDHFRNVFKNFDIDALCDFTDNDIDRLTEDQGIIRHRGKITSVINNAKQCRILTREECCSLSDFLWRYAPLSSERPVHYDAQTLKKMTQCPSSVRLSRDLKKRGWTFVGPTTLYAFMQAVGMVNDHVEGCPCRSEIESQARLR